MRDDLPTLSRQHFAALDGLRGVAIVLVLLHGFDVIQPSGAFGHALDDVLDLGWIGVQLFFVLSGFLITGILLDTRQASGYYRSFFKRRFLRIFPLYYGVLIVAFVLLPWLTGPIDGSDHQWWLWIYVANFTAPFGAGVTAFPHFWSLCVEEQFYLLWPLLVRQLGRRGVIALSSILVLIAMASRIYVRHRLGEPIGHEAAYSFTPCRMDALAIGALVAALLRGGGGAARLAGRQPGLLASIGLLVLLIGVVAGHLQRTGAMMQAFGYTVIALGFALLLVGALSRSGLAARLLAWPPLCRCGIYSYGMYVFYAPLHLFVGLPLLATLAAAPTLGEALAYEVLAIVVTFALGALSWHAYERHFLALKARLCATAGAMMLSEATATLGGLPVITIGDPDAPTVVVVLHGREMSGSDLAPFAHSLGVPAYFVFPDAPLPCAGGRSWWPVDSEARLRRLSRGPMDLWAMDPPGRAEARDRLDGLLRQFASRRRILVGFSQGGMLAMDYVLHGGRVDGLALLSSTRIAFADWQARLPCLAGLPVLVAHGRDDDELSFAAGEGLRDAAAGGGAEVRWLPFDGGHQIPLVVWRGLRQFLQGLT